VEAGSTTYADGILEWSEQNSVLTGEIIWSDSGRPSEKVSGLRKGDSLTFSLGVTGLSLGSPLKGLIPTANRFYASSYNRGSGRRLSASRLVHCPDPNLPNPNPRKLQLQATLDSIGVDHVDSTSLNAFASYAYFGDSDVVRFSQAYDTLTFTYFSYRDRIGGSKSISGTGFSLLTTPQGEKVIYGNMEAYFSDALLIGDSTDYSLNENVVIPGGLPKGKYKLVLRLRVSCFCVPGPSYFYAKEFTIE
jgi:hypothetical protein